YRQFSKKYLSLSATKKLHALILKTQLSCDPFYATQMVRLYAIYGDLYSARYVFDKSPNRSVYLWNSIIRAHAQAHRFVHTFSLLRSMLMSDIEPDGFTFACVNNSETGSYKVMLSNIYAGNERWDDARELRDYKGENQMSKMPGLSWSAGY
ncbi:hypothetical protein G4B88_024469, partial [Cannabis sativa]